ncbi:tumor necrosis factor receptor superfamily member 14-like isoform X1 [Poecilia reticulata]|uniref:tumor necrosis factor receptor superfamily member 14-like isoform X1 n=1 Tax=Poecilia reticulata TaxID=8081 RepID=UPI0004A2D360|nr:PREDICTED: tumor necrosis factor receptor superfamily member 14-like isoform X1 [Poecilia reticulata]
MISMLVMLVGVALFEPVSSTCRQKEYPTSDGQCCPMCQEGTVVGRDCTAESGTHCVPCQTGTYMNQYNGLKRCLSCATCDSGLGLFAKQNCKSTSDSVCDVLSGFFCKSLIDSTGCSTAEKHSVCKPGERIKQPGTSRHDTVCEACQPGSFSPDGVNCTLWRKCSENQTTVQDRSLTADVCRNGSLRHRYFLLLPFVCFLILCLVLSRGLW